MELDGKVKNIEKLDLKKNWLEVGCASGVGFEFDACEDKDGTRLPRLSLLDLRFNADLGAPG